MNGLEREAQEFDQILANFKNPASRTLDAASAYETIVKAVEEAQDSAEKGSEAAEEAQSMVTTATTATTIINNDREMKFKNSLCIGFFFIFLCSLV